MANVRSAPTARESLLRAGCELLNEHFVAAGERLGAGFQFISPTQVAERAGVSKGLLYHHWGGGDAPAFDAFIADVAGQLVQELNDPETLTEGVIELRQVGVGFFRTVAILGQTELESLVRDDVRRIPLMQQFVFIAYATSPPVRDALVRAADRSYADLVGFYETVLKTCGYRLKRPVGTGRPLTTTDLARAISCLTEGFAGEAQYVPAVVDDAISWEIDGTASSASLFVIALLGLVESMTEPVPDEPDDPPSA